MAKRQQYRGVQFTAKVDVMGLPEAKAALTRFPETLVRRWAMKGVRKAAGRTAKLYRQQLRRNRRTGQLGRAAGYVARVYRRHGVIYCLVGARRGMWAHVPGLGTVKPTVYQLLVEKGRKAVRAGTGKAGAKALTMIVGTAKRSMRTFGKGNRVTFGKGIQRQKQSKGSGKKKTSRFVSKGSVSTRAGWRIFSTRAAAAHGFAWLEQDSRYFTNELLSHVPAAIREGCEKADTSRATEPSVVSGSGSELI
jgi:hypothetical protein